MNTRLPLWPLCLATTAAGMAMISLGPLLDAILRDLGAARALGGVLSLAFFGGMCLAIAAVNFILGAFSSRATLMLGATLQGLGMVLAGGLAGRLGALAWSLAVIGFGYGLLTIYPGMIVTSLIKPAAERPLSIINGFFAVGVLATPLAIGQALAFGISWRGVFLGEGIISFGLLPLLLKAPLPDMPGRQNIRFRQIAEIWRHNPRLLILILLALWLYVGAENIFNVWLAKFQIDTFASSASRAGLTVSLFWLGLTIGRFGMVRLLARVPPHRIVFAAACFMAGVESGVFGDRPGRLGHLSARRRLRRTFSPLVCRRRFFSGLSGGVGRLDVVSLPGRSRRRLVRLSFGDAVGRRAEHRGGLTRRSAAAFGGRLITQRRAPRLTTCAASRAGFRHGATASCAVPKCLSRGTR